MSLRQVPTVEVNGIGSDFLLDVREDDEWAAGRAPGAVHVPMHSLPARLAELPTSQPISVICRMGGRSAQATAWLVAQGYQARNVAGGMQAWAASALPLEGDDPRPRVI